MKRAKSGNPKVAIGYVRVSTDEQALGPEAQRAALDAWAARVGVELVAVRVDHGVSGASAIEDRPGLLAALAAVVTHGAGVFVAAKRDRIARDPVVSALVERTAAKAGACVRTADGASDSSGPEGMMMRGILDVFSAYEREMIRARTRAALAVKRARGEKLGGHAPYGYRAVEGILVQVDEEQAVLALARDLRASHTLRAVVTELAARGVANRAGNAFTLTAVARMLRV